jgi:hypothetical protein
MNPQFQNQEWKRYHSTLHDGGPLYAETNLDQFIVEPWNALSSLVIVAPALYWLFVIRKDLKNYGFLLFCVPFILLGGMGSMLFHAFRSSPWLLHLDVYPIVALTFFISAYFWSKVFNSTGLALLLIAGVGLLTYNLFSFLPSHTAINLSYLIRGIALFLPIIFVLSRSGYTGLKQMIISVVLFVISLAFREIDARASIQFLPMGTHFLWHVFSGMGAFYLGSYLYRVRNYELAYRKASSRRG